MKKTTATNGSECKQSTATVVGVQRKPSVEVKSGQCPAGVGVPPDTSYMTLCPIMRNHSTEGKDLTISGTPTGDQPRPETPDEDKIDLRQMSVALMKLLYPEVSIATGSATMILYCSC